MSSILPTKRYKHAQWQISLELPSAWQVKNVNSQPGGPISIAATTEDSGWVPGVMLTLIDSNLEIAAQLDCIVTDILNKQAETTLLSKKIIERKDKSPRGLILCQRKHFDSTLVSQNVLIPLENSKYLLCDATSAKEVWNKYKDYFTTIVGSVKEISGDELEIIFTDKVVPINATALPEASSQKGFTEYAKSFDTYWKTCSRKPDLLELTGDEELAKVLWAALGSHAMSWLTDSIPALGGKTPKQCLQTTQGKDQLRKLLLKMDNEASNLFKIASLPADTPLIVNDAARHIAELLKIKHDQRNDSWYQEFCKTAAIAYFFIPDLPIVVGPDEFPYYSMFTEPPSEFHATRQMCMKEAIDDITNEGVGIVINPHYPEPFAFTFGGAWAFREQGNFSFPGDNQSKPPEANLPAGLPVMAGKPSEKVLPHYARRVLKSFIQDGLKIKKPSVYLESVGGREYPHTLVFNLVDGNRSEQEIMGMIDDLTWFIRPGYGVGACDSSPANKRVLLEL